jgi:cyanophycinase
MGYRCHRGAREARLAWVVAASLALATASPSAAQQMRAARPTVGPAHGSLVIVGGNLHDPAIYKRFIDLAGGPDAKIVIIPTAGGAPSYDKHDPALTPWRDNGARNLVLLHTYDRKVADTDEFVAPLLDADGVFFLGGRQWRLVDAYAGTKTEAAIRGVLDRGGVIGGSSAGATICGSFLVRGDTKNNTIMMGDHQVGFGYLKNVAIDQHVLRRNRQFDLIRVVEAHPELLGIGLDENTAIVVHGDMFEVMGASYALIYDDHATVGDGGRFYFLAPGDRFDLATREATRAAPGRRPVVGLAAKPWGGGM